MLFTCQNLRETNVFPSVPGTGTPYTVASVMPGNAVIASATTPKQRVLVSTLEKLAADANDQKFEPPAIVVIGDIVSMRAQLIGEAATAERETP